MLEIFSLLMAHGYSGAGAVFQMPASATDVDVLCSRSATADLFHLFSLSLGFICFWCFGSACYPSIMLLIFILFLIVLFLLRFRLLFLSVSDQLFLTFFWSLFDFFPHLHLVFHLPNFLLSCLCSLPSVPATKRFSLPMAFTNLYSHDLINDFLQSFNQHY